MSAHMFVKTPQVHVQARTIDSTSKGVVVRYDGDNVHLSFERHDVPNNGWNRFSATILADTGLVLICEGEEDTIYLIDKSIIQN